MLKNTPPTILIGTPGRLNELLRKNAIKFDNLKFFVLDECDKMLSKIGKAFNKICAKMFKLYLSKLLKISR